MITIKLHKVSIIALILLFLLPYTMYSENVEQTELKDTDLRLSLYKKTEALTQVPWYYIAAIDQYERNIGHAKDNKDRLTNIEIPLDKWYGQLLGSAENLHYEDVIQSFGGIGKDGNGDKIADHHNDEDVLYTLALEIHNALAKHGDFEQFIMNYYNDNEKATQIIVLISKIFNHFQTVDLSERAFPLPKFHNYSYRSTWGDARGYGGRRIHEGTDIFANYGVPVRSASYGIVEIKGWNKFGGWRVGIRDPYNIYHYYAHLNGFEKGIEEGTFVKPGDVIGYVGASGYGPKGTSGKFPPHLHYGMYRFNGKNEWAFDPYPYLRRWERSQ
ncbi:M23 family metallopeptidase [Bacillaceae bacterium W0354]